MLWRPNGSGNPAYFEPTVASTVTLSGVCDVNCEMPGSDLIAVPEAQTTNRAAHTSTHKPPTQQAPNPNPPSYKPRTRDTHT